VPQVRGLFFKKPIKLLKGIGSCTQQDKTHVQVRGVERILSSGIRFPEGRVITGTRKRDTVSSQYPWFSSESGKYVNWTVT